MRIEELKVGDWVVNKESREEYEILGVNLYHQRLWLGGGEFILSKNFKYFEKKEEPSFNDLIDVAVQGFKDGVIDKIMSISPESIEIRVDKENYDYSAQYVQNGISYIKSLYKETFVIETEEDLSRVLYELDPKITLKTGEVIPFIFKCVSRNSLIFEDQSGRNCIPFVFLKGATVEQDRHD